MRPCARHLALSFLLGMVACAGTKPSSKANMKHASQLDEQSFTSFCQTNIESANKLLSQILAVTGQRSVDNTLEPFNHLSIHLSNANSQAGLYANVHPEKSMRSAAEKCEQGVQAVLTELGLNRQLFEAVASVKLDGADASTKRLVSHTLREFRRSGVDKDEATRARLKKISEELVELGQEFDKNIRNDVRSIQVTVAQMDGLPKDYIAAHPPGKDGKATITTDYPDYFPFRTYATDSAARLELFKVYTSRAYPDNESVLKKILVLRKERAGLLGFKNWGDFITDNKMARSSKNVRDFLQRLEKASGERAKKDRSALLARKKKDDPAATSISQADSVYYDELVKREQFSFDSQAVRPYFEFTRVRDGLLAITSTLFGVSYKPVKESSAWHQDVSVYDVFRGGDKLGRIYLDLHPRAGKYKHAAQFTVANGVADQQLPEGALVCNFPNPREKTPALMGHDQVVTLFHEFGHLMHHVLGGGQRWIDFSGVATEWDFVEAPSQMLEEWAWDSQVLQTFAKHHETDEPIPAELVARMRAANEFGKGAQVRHQIFYAALSLAIHTADDPKSIDFDKLTEELQSRYSMFDRVPDTHFYANFGHLNGYSAMYYTYQWSLVIAKDLFSAFEKPGIMDPETAHKYRDTILAPGGSKDASELIKDFLGRDYSFDTYRDWLNRD